MLNIDKWLENNSLVVKILTGKKILPNGTLVQLATLSPLTGTIIQSDISLKEFKLKVGDTVELKGVELSMPLNTGNTIENLIFLNKEASKISTSVLENYIILEPPNILKFSEAVLGKLNLVPGVKVDFCTGNNPSEVYLALMPNNAPHGFILNSEGAIVDEGAYKLIWYNYTSAPFYGETKRSLPTLASINPFKYYKNFRYPEYIFFKLEVNPRTLGYGIKGSLDKSEKDFIAQVLIKILRGSSPFKQKISSYIGDVQFSSEEE